ncbi:flagellar basal-body rod protein FlgG [Anaerotignum neopropionicum]|uniref:Flagellar hook protein FlgE n=1 Tax=Anaerotignum neopropionicum TaxID=36847 RepID=A0A136WJH1_9FIRM|nr:flagellar hook-basal body complex protein [Anaerotignum neopropionicum]KXL54540.1 flagellar basal-body rod protein FlgG [Anaerotignum neopropionicum]
MVKSMFSAIAGLRAHQQKMDVIGNNIANVNTYGYKAGRVTFKESIYQTTSSSSNGNDVFGGSNPSQVGYGSQVGTIDLMFSSGAYAPTDSGLDCMIDGEGFFIIGNKGIEIELDGDDPAEISEQMTQLMLSRVGNFTFDGDGYLCDGSGNIVYGFGYTGTDGAIDTGYLQAIRVPDDDDGIPVKLNSVSISKTGEITGNDASGKSISVGVLAIANVPNPNALEKSQGPYYSIRENTGYVAPYKPGEGTTGSIINYGLEMSNVDLAKEFSEMITTQRGFQANTRIISVTDAMLEELVNIKR